MTRQALILIAIILLAGCIASTGNPEADLAAAQANITVTARARSEANARTLSAASVTAQARTDAEATAAQYRTQQAEAPMLTLDAIRLTGTTGAEISAQTFTPAAASANISSTLSSLRLTEVALPALQTRVAADTRESVLRADGMAVLNFLLPIGILIFAIVMLWIIGKAIHSVFDTKNRIREARARTEEAKANAEDAKTLREMVYALPSGEAVILCYDENGQPYPMRLLPAPKAEPEGETEAESGPGYALYHMGERVNGSHNHNKPASKDDTKTLVLNLLNAAIKATSRGGDTIPRYEDMPDWRTRPDLWVKATDGLGGLIRKEQGAPTTLSDPRYPTLMHLRIAIERGELPLPYPAIVDGEFSPGVNLTAFNSSNSE